MEHNSKSYLLSRLPQEVISERLCYILTREVDMQSSIIGKIEKAKRYAQEPDRVTFSDFRARFRGEHNTYDLSYRDGKWHCSCFFFSRWQLCSHTMALQRILFQMLPKEALVTTKVPEEP